MFCLISFLCSFETLYYSYKTFSSLQCVVIPHSLTCIHYRRHHKMGFCWIRPFGWFFIEWNNNIGSIHSLWICMGSQSRHLNSLFHLFVCLLKLTSLIVYKLWTLYRRLSQAAYCELTFDFSLASFLLGLSLSIMSTLSYIGCLPISGQNHDCNLDFTDCRQIRILQNPIKAYRLESIYINCFLRLLSWHFASELLTNIQG